MLPKKKSSRLGEFSKVAEVNFTKKKKVNFTKISYFVNNINKNKKSKLN